MSPVVFPLSPRIVVEIACVQRADGRWLAASRALPGTIGGGLTADEAASKLARLAERYTGEPVKAVITVLDIGADQPDWAARFADGTLSAAPHDVEGDPSP